MRAQLASLAEFHGLTEEDTEARCAALHCKFIALALIREAENQCLAKS